LKDRRHYYSREICQDKFLQVRQKLVSYLKKIKQPDQDQDGYVYEQQPCFSEGNRLYGVAVEGVLNFSSSNCPLALGTSK